MARDDYDRRYNRRSDYGNDYDYMNWGYLPDDNRNFYDRNWDYNRPYYRNTNWDNRYNRPYNRTWDYDYYDEDYDEDLYAPDWTYTETWWLVPGPYSGVGPMGYTRTDDRIEDDINYRLASNGRLDASNIMVDVDDGVVTLTGSVRSRRDKRLAEDIADSVYGVMDVHNNLRVQHQGKHQQGPQSKMIPCGSIYTGMEVVGSQGKHVGSVKEIRDNDFLVDRSMSRDIFIPFSACQSVDDQIHLNVKADDVGKHGWEEPQVMRTSGQS